MSAPREAAVEEKEFLQLEAMLEQPKQQHNELMDRALSSCTEVFKFSLWPSASGSPKKQLKPTAYLDGLRGFAALLVYSLHHELWAHETDWALEDAFGWDGNYKLICFPFIRVFFSGGHTAVAIFFVISGYVLSLSALNMIQSGESARLADHLCSALFRRWLRLFIPVACTTFVYMTTWHLFNIRSSNPIADPPERTFADEVWKWYCDFKNFSFIFTAEPTNKYNDHTWSIPTEFRGSIVVWTAALAFARCRTKMRLCFEAVLIFYFLYVVDGWYCALFMTGLLLCDIDLLAQKDQLPDFFHRLKPLEGWIYYVLILASLYLGGVPSISNELSHLRKEPGWYYLSFLKPQAFWDFRWFFRYWAATFAMIAIPRISWLRRFFETSFCQYLGRISFGLYLVHGPVLWTVGDRVYAAVGRLRVNQPEVVGGWINLFPFPGWGIFGLEINYLIPHLILLPFTLWCAEIVTKLFDEPSVKYSRWLFDHSAEPKRGSR
jgi:peptidoglycan/LPS O-acetylase OafA/YrhL